MAGEEKNIFNSLLPTVRSSIGNGIASVRNYVFPTPDNMGKGVEVPGRYGNGNPKRDARNYITPVQIVRRRVDIKSWRNSLNEAESAWFPHRVKMQTMYWDTAVNGHVVACLKKRKDLSLLREWTFKNEAEVENPKQKAQLDKRWFTQFLEYALEARFYGYQLIALGDLVNGEFPNIGIIRRVNVSPDRLNVTSYVYSITGEQFLEGEMADWHCWINTPSDVGISRCGYGELYPVAYYEILNRNNKGQNADANELFGMPWMHARTDKTEGEEYDRLNAALANRGSAGYVITDKQDDINPVESKSLGQGYKTFGDFEHRNDQYISQILLGHADAISSIPGKLGNSKEKSPAEVALEAKQTNDGAFLEDVVNNILIPKLMKMPGFKFDPAYKFCFDNNAEKMEIRKRTDENNLAFAQVVYQLNQAGLEVDAAQVEEATGLKVTKIVVPPPTKPTFDPAVKNRLSDIYK